MDRFSFMICCFSCYAVFGINSLNTSVSDLMDELINTEYDSKTRPDELSGGETEVTVSMFIQSITSIDAVKMEITLTCLLYESWRDDRLASDKFNGTINLDYSEHDRLWLPDLYFPNERDVDVHTSPLPNRLFQLSTDGTLQYAQRITLKLDCDMDLLLFPLDNQTCKIYIASFTYNTDQMSLKWNAASQLTKASGARLPEFEITELTTYECEDEQLLTGSFPCIYGEIHIRRDRMYYLFQLYIPSMIVVMLSWVNFWIDAAAVPARVSLAILTVIQINSQNSGITSRLPRESYTKAIDVWMGGCLIFVFAGLVEYCLVNVYNRKDRTDKDFRKHDLQDSDDEDPLEDTEVDVHTSDPLSSHLGNKLKTIKTWTKSVKLVQIKKKSLKKRAKRFAKLKWRRWSTTRGMFIDVVSRVLFPIAFVIFNFVYWLVYLVFPKELGLIN